MCKFRLENVFFEFSLSEKVRSTFSSTLLHLEDRMEDRRLLVRHYLAYARLEQHGAQGLTRELVLKVALQNLAQVGHPRGGFPGERAQQESGGGQGGGQRRGPPRPGPGRGVAALMPGPKGACQDHWACWRVVSSGRWGVAFSARAYGLLGAGVVVGLGRGSTFHPWVRAKQSTPWAMPRAGILG